MSTKRAAASAALAAATIPLQKSKAIFFLPRRQSDNVKDAIKSVKPAE